MKFKSVISLILVCTVFFSTIAFAEALRRDPELIKETVRPQPQSNDIFFDDFTNYAEGSRPTVTRSNGNNGTLLVGVNDVGGGLKKNCLELTDLADSGGPQAIIDMPNPTGIVSVETRYKYTSTDGAPWSVFRLTLHGNDKGTAKEFARFSLQSGNGHHYYNSGGLDQTPVLSEPVKEEIWYHVKMYVDFNTSLAYTVFTNESTGKTTYATEKSFYSEYVAQELMQVRITSSVGTGKWTVDYVRVSQEKELPDFPEEDTDIPKGVEAIKVQGAVNHAVPGRINIKLDGRYKYLSAAPYISDNGRVMVSVKNIANIFGLGYTRNGFCFTMKSGESEYVFNAGEAQFTADGKLVDLLEASVQKAYQLYVPLRSVAETLGYEVGYDAENRCVIIVTPSEDGGKKNGI